MFKYSLITLAVLFAPWPPGGMTASQIKFKDRSIHAPSSLGKFELYHSNDGTYSAYYKGKKTDFAKHSVSPELRSLTNDQLSRYQDNAYFMVKEQSDGELSLKSQVKGNGGGPIVANAIYWLVKGGAYGLIGAATTNVLSATGGALGLGSYIAGQSTPVILGGTALKTAAPHVAAESIKAIGTTATILGTKGATALKVGVTATKLAGGAAYAAGDLVGGAIVSVAPEAAMAVTETVATKVAMTGTLGYIVGGIESVALGAWAWAVTWPTP